MMKRESLFAIFLRSFFIHAALNFRRMQNLGFAYALIPLLRERKLAGKEAEEMLVRHLQMFSTHPYLSAPLIGSIVRLEEDRRDGDDAAAIAMVKQSLMGPYAAIGDTFFWGALRPCAGILSAGLAWLGCIFSPFAFILIYTPAHLWIRVKGFLEGYRRGKQGIKFIRGMDLPRISARVRWVSLVALSGLGIGFLRDGYSDFAKIPGMATAAAMLAVILFCRWLIQKGVSQIYILYGAAMLFMIYSSRGLWFCWK